MIPPDDIDDISEEQLALMLEINKLLDSHTVAAGIGALVRLAAICHAYEGGTPEGWAIVTSLAYAEAQEMNAKDND